MPASLVRLQNRALRGDVPVATRAGSGRSRRAFIAAQVGITERAAQRILADLIADGYATRTKTGRRNHYKVNPHGHLRHPVYRNLPIGPLLDVLDTANWPSTSSVKK